MKKTLRLISLTVIALIAVLSLSGCEFSFGRGKEPINESHKVNDAFTDIDIIDNCGHFDITIKETSEDFATISYTGNKKTELFYEVAAGKLTVKCIDKRNAAGKVMDFSDDAKLTLSLPSNDYGKLMVKTDSGNVKIYSVKGSSLEIYSYSGDISVYDSTLGTVMVDSSSSDLSIRSVKSTVNLTIDLAGGDTDIKDSEIAEFKHSSTSGDIEIESTAISGASDIDASSGEVDFLSVNANEVQIETSSGDVTIKDSITEKKLEIKTLSGEVEFFHIDAGEMNISTESGDVEGTVLTIKNFITSSKSGVIKVPASDRDAGACHINTVSGDIEVRVSNQ